MTKPRIVLNLCMSFGSSFGRTYSKWVIDREYDWSPKCCVCHAVIEEGGDPQTTRLGCLRM
ncbi:hypothetical protein ACSBR1_016444 [Camellia fascicularis]